MRWWWSYQKIIEAAGETKVVVETQAAAAEEEIGCKTIAEDAGPATLIEIFQPLMLRWSVLKS